MILYFVRIGQDYYMKGMFSSEKFMFLDIKVTPCVTPNDPKLTWNPVCAPAEEVKNFLRKIINPSHFLTPIKKISFLNIKYTFRSLESQSEMVIMGWISTTRIMFSIQIPPPPHILLILTTNSSSLLCLIKWQLFVISTSKILPWKQIHPCFHFQDMKRYNFFLRKTMMYARQSNCSAQMVSM